MHSSPDINTDNSCGDEILPGIQELWSGHNKTDYTHGQKANRCLTISDLALKIKESDGLPGSVIRKSDTIFRGLGLSIVSNVEIQ